MKFMCAVESCRNTFVSLEELRKAMETLTGLFSHSISHSPNLPLVFL